MNDSEPTGGETYQDQLSQEKRRDYRKTVLLQLFLLSAELLLEDLMRLFAWPVPVNLLKLLFFGLSGVYLFFLWDMLRNFTLKRWLTNFVLAVVVLSFGSLFVVDIVLGGRELQNPGIRLACHCALVWVQIVVIGFAMRDLFQGSSHDADKLWGSACIFFMSGFVFAGAYFCVLIKDPLAFGRPLPYEYWALFESLYLSMTALIGQDNAYSDCSRLVRNLALMEGAWSQLYLVLLIGRLLSKEPSAENQSNEKKAPPEADGALIR